MAYMVRTMLSAPRPASMRILHFWAMQGWCVGQRKIRCKHNSRAKRAPFSKVGLEPRCSDKQADL
eukprot:4922950-Amphidinium_carterae.1